MERGDPPLPPLQGPGQQTDASQHHQLGSLSQGVGWLQIGQMAQKDTGAEGVGSCRTSRGHSPDMGHAPRQPRLSLNRAGPGSLAARRGGQTPNTHRQVQLPLPPGALVMPKLLPSHFLEPGVCCYSKLCQLPWSDDRGTGRGFGFSSVNSGAWE